jgi:UPF0716 protein FxsA
MWLLLMFILIPLIEIGLFIQLGGFLGLWNTLLVVLITAILGSWLVRTQGAQAIERIRGSFSELNDPTEALAHGAMILFAGVLLVTPGFFTDGVGFLLMFPPFRLAAFNFLRTRVKVASFSVGGAPAHTRPRPSDVIDGEYTEIDPENRPSNGPSGWTKD